MSAPELTPQIPGQLPGTDSDALSAGTVEDILAALPALDDLDLGLLEAAERAGKARTTALGAIIRERDRREAGPADEPSAGHDAPSVGPTSYAHLPASAVDPRKITSNVLTRDGWVCPHPAAVAQG